MEPTSNIDRLVLLLRHRLAERPKVGTSRTAKRQPGRPPPAVGLAAVQALAALDGTEDRHLRRAVIQGILRDHFGPQLLNEARFQQVIDQVTQTLEDEPAGSRLLDRIVAELRASAR